MSAGGDLGSSPLYASNSSWKDVSPIYLTEVEQGAVRIAVNEQFTDVFAYFRAIMQTREMSQRVLDLIGDCIRLNPSNYSVWQYRRELIEALELDLKAELTYIGEVIEEQPKNYQVWHHRRYIVEKLGAEAVPEELFFMAGGLSDEPKNYHAWQHRHWLLRRFPAAIDVDSEVAFTLKLIMEDPRNNSAWNYRYSLLERTEAFPDNEKMAIEINLCIKLLEKMTHNESIWNYLAGIAEDVEAGKKAEIVAFVEDLYERTEAGKRAPYLVSFLGDVLLERVEKGEDAEGSYKKAKELYKELETLDPVRRNYWKNMQIRSDNAYQKQLLKESQPRT